MCLLLTFCNEYVILEFFYMEFRQCHYIDLKVQLQRENCVALQSEMSLYNAIHLCETEGKCFVTEQQCYICSKCFKRY
jgi:hypothetical protein